MLDAADASAFTKAEDRRIFEIMPALANPALHRYIKDLAALRAVGDDTAGVQKNQHSFRWSRRRRPVGGREFARRRMGWVLLIQ